MRRGTTKAADYWGLGVLIFEMLVGDPPFKSLTGEQQARRLGRPGWTCCVQRPPCLAAALLLLPTHRHRPLCC
jgi:hypothetical protein